MKSVPPLYDHQSEALEFVEDLRQFALFMEQGTGKSKVIVEQSNRLFSRGDIDCTIIISPNGVKHQWVEDQFEEHYPGEFFGHVWEGGTTKQEKSHFDDLCSSKSLAVFSMNVESLQSDSVDVYLRHLLREREVFLVVDESTRIKNGRRKPVRGIRGGAKRTNKLLDMASLARYRAILTGTPTPKNPFDLWSQFEFLCQNFFGLDYFMFTHQYGIMIQATSAGNKRYHKVLDVKDFNIIKDALSKLEKIDGAALSELAIRRGMKMSDIMRIHKMSSYSPYKNLEELKAKIATVTFFKKKSECLDLPDKVYEKIYVDMGTEQKKLYAQLKKDLYANYAGKELSVTHKLIMVMRLQMIAAGLFPYEETPGTVEPEYKTTRITNPGKIRALIDDLEEVSEDVSIIVWARFRGEVEMIADALQEAGYSVGVYYGGSSNQVISDFRAKKFRILVGTASKGGLGLNLQVATLQYFHSNTFVGDDRPQAEDRSHRSGQTEKVTYKDLICKGTVDQHIYDSLMRKISLINYFQDKDLKELLL